MDLHGFLLILSADPAFSSFVGARVTLVVFEQQLLQRLVFNLYLDVFEFLPVIHLVRAFDI